MTFKHIRTSILPFGYNALTKSYRFSLCIDLNPNYPADVANDPSTLQELGKFIQSFGVGSPSLFFLLSSQIKLKIDNQHIATSQLCFEREIIDEVGNYWKNEVFSKKISKRVNGDHPPVPYTDGLDISTRNTESTFGDHAGLPDPHKIRQLAVNSVADSKKKGKLLNFTNSLSKELKSLNKVTEDFSNNLNGILSFAEERNSIQSKQVIKEQNSQIKGNSDYLHLSLYDSIDSILDLWSFIDSNIILQRFLGKTIDFEIPESALHGKSNFQISLDEFADDIKDTIATLFKLEWEHLTTPCVLKSGNLIIVQEEALLDNYEISLKSTNYDVGGKLIGQKAINKKYQDYLNQLNDPSKMESEKFQIRKLLMSLDTAALTVGINTYNTTLAAILEIERKLEHNAEKIHVDTGNNIPNFLFRIKKGYRFAVKSSASQHITPIGNRKVALFSNGVKKQLPDELSFQHIAINSDSGSHALIEDPIDGALKAKVIQDPVILNWAGENIGMLSIFSNQEDEVNNDSTIDEGSISDSTKFVSEELSNFFSEEYKISGVIYETLSKNSNSIIKLNTNKSNLPFLIEYSLENIENKKLILGRNYRIILTPEYKNGWGVPFDQLDTLRGERSHYLEVNSFDFKRNEPVKPIELRLQEPLSESNGKPTKLREGESLDKLVIRNLSYFDDNKVYKTQQKSIRYILPPAISFQQAFWHNKLFNKNEEFKDDAMTIDESHQWYMKYHFPAEEGKDFMKWNNRGEWVKEPTGKKDENGNPIFRKYTPEEVIRGSTNMQAYYPDNCQINYLPDPLSIGFRFEYYKDKNRTIKAIKYEEYEQLEFYFNGKYPKINSWKLILEDYNLNETELLLIDTKKMEITIRLEKGDEIFISARTILSYDYEKQFETFGNYNDFTRYGNNDLLTPPLEFSLVHATQRPLVRPKFANIIKPYKSYKEKERDKSIFQTTIRTNIEQTGIYYDEAGIVHYIEENIPTGNLEVYAKWEEYRDDPKLIVSDDWTPNDPINKIDKINFNNTEKETPATFETTIEISKHLDAMEATLHKTTSEKNDFKNYAVDLKISYDVKETKFIEKFLWIKNKSKFTSYFPKEWGIEDDDESKSENPKSKEYFNRRSSDSFLVRILNSKKPNSPIVADENINLVSVTEDLKTNKSIFRTASMNRLRFFFERGRLTSGKGERIGFVVNEPQAIYNDYLVKNDLISIVGRDIVSDSLKPYDGLFRNEDVLLTKSNFVINDPYDLRDFETNRKSNDLESFSPKYVKELGLMTYLPKFDKKQNLWYLDIELDINDYKGRELHSPFIRFSIVHYQENSFNYNSDIENDITKDCRVSEINKSRYVYILSSRNIKIEYETRPVNGYKKGVVKIDLIFDESSLKDGNPSSNISKFYMVIRHRIKTETKWVIADKNAEKDGSAFLRLDSKTAELEFIFYKNNTDYQVVILETEDWGNDNDTTFDALIENKDSRIVHVNTFEISNSEL